MKSCIQGFLAIIFILILCTSSFAMSNQPLTNSEEVVRKSYVFLGTGDIKSLGSLFYSIPMMEKNEDAWLNFLKNVSEKIIEEQLITEVVIGCGKELEEIAVVLTNKTMRKGKPVRDPDFQLLVKEKGKWLLLPDGWHKNFREEVRMALSEKQIKERNTLIKWIKEMNRSSIYGGGSLTWVVGENGGYTAKCKQP